MPSVRLIDKRPVHFTYLALGQVTSAKKYWSDGTPAAGQQTTFDFDDIGNRKSAASGGDQTGANLRSATYGANLLNQYTNRAVPGYVDILGSATNTASVSVNTNMAYRRGDYYRAELTVNNAAGPLWLSVTNVAVMPVGSGNYVVSNVTGNVYVPQSPETFVHDADGNLTNSGRWSITWDAENRATSFTRISGTPSGSKVKVECAYDHRWRRTQKIVSTWNGSAYVAQSTNKFVYDGWNLIAILDPQSSILQSLMWGLDLSGTMQGAGGVGGLLVVSNAANGAHFVAYDGNGNVTALVKATDGTVSANYEFGPFGELLRATGPMAEANPFRFSTKYQDGENDLLHYGYRYYDPDTGRWLSRDPIEEYAFASQHKALVSVPPVSRNKNLQNLYVFSCNSSPGHIDLLGLAAQGSSPCACGLDVTTSLNSTLKDIEAKYAVLIDYCPSRDMSFGILVGSTNYTAPLRELKECREWQPGVFIYYN